MDLLRRLRYFVVVAEELHFGRAAGVLGMAQPPLSQAIQRLERELQVTLFDRTHRGVNLTTAGQVLMSEARTLLLAETRTRTLMRKVRDGALGTLRAGVPPEMSAAALRELLDRIAEQAPGLEVDLQELTTAEQVQMLLEARLDVGLVTPPIDAVDLSQGPVVELPLGVVLPRDSPLSRFAEIELSDLAGHDLLLPPRANAPGWYDQVLQTCRERGFQPARIRHARNPDFGFGLVLAGHAVVFESESSARREPRVAWRPLSGRPLRRQTSAVWPRRSPHPAAARFAEIATQVLSGEAAPASSLTGPDSPGPWSIVYDDPPA